MFSVAPAFISKGGRTKMCRNMHRVNVRMGDTLYFTEMRYLRSRLGPNSCLKKKS